MPLWLDYAPLVYGVFVFVFMDYGAWDHIDTARKENRPPQAGWLRSGDEGLRRPGSLRRRACA
jgi:hypothetical protein